MACHKKEFYVSLRIKYMRTTRCWNLRHMKWFFSSWKIALSLSSLSVQFVGTIWLHLFTISPIDVPLVQFHVSCSRILLRFTGHCANYTSISVRFYNKNNHNSNNNNNKNQLRFAFLLWSMLLDFFLPTPNVTDHFLNENILISDIYLPVRIHFLAQNKNDLKRFRKISSYWRSNDKKYFSAKKKNVWNSHFKNVACEWRFEKQNNGQEQNSWSSEIAMVERKVHRLVTFNCGRKLHYNIWPHNRNRIHVYAQTQNLLRFECKNSRNFHIFADRLFFVMMIIIIFLFISFIFMCYSSWTQ